MLPTRASLTRNFECTCMPGSAAHGRHCCSCADAVGAETSQALHACAPWEAEQATACTVPGLTMLCAGARRSCLDDHVPEVIDLVSPPVASRGRASCHAPDVAPQQHPAPSCYPYPTGGGRQVFLQFDINDNMQQPFMNNGHRCARSCRAARPCCSPQPASLALHP